jgi:IPT/TIG domain-containing protein
VRDRRRSVVPLLAGLALAASLALAPSSALAICKDPPCTGDPGPKPTPTPTPTVTTKITGISPGFAWSGDTLTITGAGFNGATVAINSQAATITGASSTQLSVVVPSITNAQSGPNQIPVVVSSPTGTATSSFTLSPTLQASASGTYGVNAQFGQGEDGSAGSTATLDRSSGFENEDLTVVDTQTWLSLSINMSTAWLDSSGKVIGFTPVHNVTSTGWIYHWPSGDTTAKGSFTDVVGPNPGVAPQARSARILLVRDHEAELESTLSNAVALGKTIADVVKTLAAFA